MAVNTVRSHMTSDLSSALEVALMRCSIQIDVYFTLLYAKWPTCQLAHTKSSLLMTTRTLGFHVVCIKHVLLTLLESVRRQLSADLMTNVWLNSSARWFTFGILTFQWVALLPFDFCLVYLLLCTVVSYLSNKNWCFDKTPWSFLQQIFTTFFINSVSA